VITPFGSRSNIDDSDTSLHMSNSRAALLERDAQRFAKGMLAHVKAEAALTHSHTDIRVDGGCASGRVFSLCFFHVGKHHP
jgi:hypothetical protein